MISDIGTLNPEQMLQQQQILRQQKMAEMLMQQGMQQPQGQMVSGRYVAPSIFQNIAGLANQYVGQRGIEKAQQAQIDLAKQLRADETSAMADFMQQRQGRPAEMFAAQAGPMPDGGNIPLQESRAAIAPNPQAAFANLYADPRASATQRQFAFTKMNEGPMKVGDALLDPNTFKPIYQSERKPVVVSPGGALVDEKGKLIYQAPFKPEAGEGGQDGGYNKKGDWITPNKIFIGKSEVSKDREIAFTADQVRQGLKEISPEDVKKASSVFGNLTGSGPINYLAQQLGNEAVAAQTKINASSVMQILNNLPPGPASDKDIENAKSTFPGYGNQKALNEWIKNTRDSLDRKVNSLNQKYGSESWYGNANLNALSAEDKAALDWANANPKDPRSAQIKQRLGK
jgi:hypothetical protein